MLLFRQGSLKTFLRGEDAKLSCQKRAFPKRNRKELSYLFIPSFLKIILNLSSEV